MELNALKRDPSRPLNDVRVTPILQAPNSPKPKSPYLPPHLQPVEPKLKWYQHCYDGRKKTLCGRSSKSWVLILAYSIFYIIFLSTFTMILLYISLSIIKHMKVFNPDHLNLLFYDGPRSIGLTATPTAVNKMSLISYKDRDSSDYMKYVTALENVVNKSKLDSSKQLGPCGVAPFGYGDAPCVIVRINRHYSSSALPLKPESVKSDDIPRKIRPMAIQASKLWLHCSGSSPHDTEHIGTVKYYPDPPGFEPGSFTPGNASNTGLIGVQFSNFTKGIAIAVECSLYYEGGKSSADFVLYVSSLKNAS